MEKKIFLSFILSFLFSFSSYSQGIRYEFANYLYERLGRSEKVSSVDFTISEERGRFDKPESFNVTFYFSKDSSSLFMSYLKNEQGVHRKVVLTEGEIKEDITYLVESRRLNRWFRIMRRNFRKTPSGEYENYPIE
jgi:hypothetical protein